jgi:hypothetical protein
VPEEALMPLEKIHIAPALMDATRKIRESPSQPRIAPKGADLKIFAKKGKKPVNASKPQPSLYPPKSP